VIGCEIAQIAKSIIFRIKESDKPVLVVASGINRVNEKRVAEVVLDKLGKADGDFVRERTGFVIGGVAR
jgi:prolyl-tRNA editing enzyme YbaK/EbsC (Cys-tRNA(Pro) deacylase)